MERGLQETIYKKMEEPLQKIFYNKTKFESKVHSAVKYLLEAEDYIYFPTSVIVGDRNFYAQITTFIK